MNEAWVQRKIIERHQKKGWLVIKIITCTFNGCPDLLCLKNGVAVFIEVKRPGVKTAAPLQVYRHRQLRDLGFDCYLTDDPNFEINENTKPPHPSSNPVIIEPIELIDDFNEVVDTFREVMAQEKPVKKLKAKRKRND
jgi:hypothetical protein